MKLGLAKALPLPRLITADGHILIDPKMGSKAGFYYCGVPVDHHFLTNPQTTLWCPVSPSASLDEIRASITGEEVYDNREPYSISLLCSIVGDTAYVHYERVKIGTNNNAQIWEFDRVGDYGWKPKRQIIAYPEDENPDNPNMVFGTLGCTAIKRGEYTYQFYGRDDNDDEIPPSVYLARKQDVIEQWNHWKDDSFSEIGISAIGTPLFGGYFPQLVNDGTGIVYERAGKLYYRKFLNFPAHVYDEWYIDVGHYPAHYPNIIDGYLFYCIPIVDSPTRQLMWVGRKIDL